MTAADQINGGDGSDTVILDGDYSHGVVFSATIDASAAANSVTPNGNRGSEKLVGGSGNDQLTDEFGGNDTLTGGRGNDYLTIYRKSFAGINASTVRLDGGDNLTSGKGRCSAAAKLICGI